jgi:hypothetical protein
MYNGWEVLFVVAESFSNNEQVLSECRKLERTQEQKGHHYRVLSPEVLARI